MRSLSNFGKGYSANCSKLVLRDFQTFSETKVGGDPISYVGSFAKLEQSAFESEQFSVVAVVGKLQDGYAVV